MKPLQTLIALLFSLYANSQTGVFTDSRDGQRYNTIIINGKKWFRENLRFQTANSFCPNFNKDSADCKDGNYYSNSDLPTVCPTGWHVATIPEWESYISLLLKNNNISDGSFTYDTIPSLKNNYALSIKGAFLFTDTLLQLKPTGWIEGLNRKNESNLNFWITDPVTLDDKYHLHIGKDGFVKHSHTHHIIDKPRKVRKFPVRCVCELKN
jgi:uncharacterized protein (TIGR02145 family)